MKPLDTMARCDPCWNVFLLVSVLSALMAHPAAGQDSNQLRAGAAVVDITPQKFPVIVNGMFTQREATNAHDRLHARALVLDDGRTRLGIVVVDSCMMPRELIDLAKELAHRRTGLPTDHMLVSATHTHSAPSAMGCLGSDADTNYVRFLPGKIAEAIERAAQNLAPARIGWGAIEDRDHTFCRRWVFRSDKIGTDPFGAQTVRANMHPGYQNPNVIGPSGPVDPGLTLLSVQSSDGRPLALLANYSMHYYDSPLLSADYFGLFTEKFARRIGATNGNGPFVAIMSQGTSGDQARMDYSRPQHDLGLEAYTEAVTELAYAAYEKIVYQAWVPLAMREAKIAMAFRVPDQQRLEWASNLVANLHGRLPQTLPEIYAREQVALHERPMAELKLQAIRIGDLGITGIPNEVFGITGLKLKAQSPLQQTFNMSLANGSEGYIPPPEQHHLGGYTTWPARTAGLEVQAEPKIVETLLALLEQVSDRPRKSVIESSGPAVTAVLEARPVAYWRLDEFNGPRAHDATGKGHDGTYEPGVAFYLEGPQSPGFSGTNAINRAALFAGGRLRAAIPGLSENYSVDFWFWNGFPNDTRPVTGYLFSRGTDRAEGAPGDHLGIGGTHDNHQGQLIFFNGNKLGEVLAGRTIIEPKTWNHVALVRKGKKVSVYLNGNSQPEISGEAELAWAVGEQQVFLGGRSDNFANFEGKLDEVALFDRALTASEIVQLHRASGLPIKPLARRDASYELESLPRSPVESLALLHLRDGFEIELMAAEPLVQSPVAIDWGPDGRLWVAEMADYPMGLDGQMKPGGRVRFLEASHGDGKFDRSTIFLDDLNFPNGILSWRKGALITAAPDILYAEDSDGDGKADVRQTLFTGFGEGNLQLRINGLRWGVDNWVYCANGWSGGRPRSLKTGTQVDLSGHDLRLKPDDGSIDLQSGQSEFGRNRDDWGNWFGCDNSYPLFHFVIGDEYLRRGRFLATPDTKKQLYLPANPAVYPRSKGQKRYHSFEHAGHFTSACSTDFYRDELLFPVGPVEHAFVCEPVHNLVQHLEVTEDGVTFRVRRAEAPGEDEFLASEDQWFRPVMVRTGPDGALWVVDMYRYMIEHPDWLPPEGKQELAPFYRAGADQGRIYRIYPKGKRPAPWPRLDRMTSAELVEVLASPNGWQRDKAQQLLLWRADKSAVEPLERMVLASPSPLARLHALYTLDGLGALKVDWLAQALGDRHPAVRRHALRLAETRAREARELMQSAFRLVADPDRKVRLQLACTLGAWDGPEAGKALAQVAVADAEDPYFRAAIISSAENHCEALVEEVVSAHTAAADELAAPLLNLALALNRRDLMAQLLDKTFSPQAGQFSQAQLNCYGQFLEALGKRGTSATELARKQDDALRRQLHRAGELFAAAHQAAGDKSRPSAARAMAVNLLGRDEDSRSDDVELLSKLLGPQSPADVQRAAIKALGRIGDSRSLEALFQHWTGCSPEQRGAVVQELLVREGSALDLLGRVERGQIVAKDLEAQQRERFLKHRSEKVRALAAKVLAIQASSDRQKVIDRFRPALQLNGDAAHGQELFAKLCVTCHRLGGQGHEIGPNLLSVRSHSAEKLLTSILDPSREVEPRYLAYTCTLADEEELYGLIISEGGNSLTLKLGDDTTRTVLRSDVVSLRSAKVSLMPDGLEAGLSCQDLADLIRYLQSTGAAN